MSATFTVSELNDVLPALRRFAFSLTRDEDRADDLVQDSVERALVKSEHFEPGTNLRSWMFTVCRRIFLNQIRKQKNQGISVEIDDAPQAKLSAEASQDMTVACKEMLAAMEKLPLRDKVVLSLIVVEGMKYDEAAKVLEVPVGTVRSRLSRARARLKDLIEQGDANEAVIAA